MELKHPALPYVAPFATFIAFLVIDKYFPFGPEVAYPLRLAVVCVILLLFSRQVIDLRLANPVATVLLGVMVFAIWVGPDVLWPEYRTHPVFTFFGEAKSSAPESLKSNLAFILLRAFGCAVVVPVIEEIFWRGWLARWLINSDDFRAVKFIEYTPAPFWIGSLLFASEHGPYWDVGLITGVIYNWWMIRTKSLGNCIWLHAVTNACLSAYVLTTDQWQYWM